MGQGRRVVNDKLDGQGIGRWEGRTTGWNGAARVWGRVVVCRGFGDEVPDEDWEKGPDFEVVSR